jgi:cytoskeleton protein RodZ
MTETIGQQLKQAREGRYLTIEKVVEATRIRAHYIEAMEADNFDLLPSTAQARGFLRLYAGFLGLSVEELIARQRGGDLEAPAAPAEAAPQTIPAEPPTSEPVAAVETEPPAPVEKAAKANREKKTAAGKPAARSAPVRKTKKPIEDEPQPLLEDDPVSTPQEPEAEPAVATLPPLPGRSKVIFDAIGGELRARRESLSLTLDEVERHTRVRKHYLQALEAGAFERLPSSVQARGMLSNYAHFLDLDVDAILLKFADGLQARLQERQPSPASEPETPEAKPRFRLPFKLPPRLQLPPALRRYLSTDLLVGGGLIIFLVIFAVWGTERVIGLTAVQTPQPTAPSISDILITNPGTTATPTSTPAAGAAPGGIYSAGGSTPVIAISTGGQGPVQIVLAALSSTWVRVSVDGKTKFEGRLTPGSAYPYDGRSQIEILTGNGAAISVTYNENNLGPMGTFGQVVDRIYTINGILNPTATFTPSPTITPIPSSTPRPSATLRPSSTPRRTP